MRAMNKLIDKYYTVKEAAEVIRRKSGKSISVDQVRRICRGTAAGMIVGRYGLEAEFIAGTWLIPEKALANFERMPLGPRGPRKPAK